LVRNHSSFQIESRCIDPNLNIKIEYNKSEKQSESEFDTPLELYEGQAFQTVDKTFVVIETFAYSHRFGIQKERVEKDTTGHEISRSFLCYHAGKPLTEKKSYKTEESGSCRTDCK
ncbi:28520_t:CDS:2, partial [Racocetra persica]